MKSKKAFGFTLIELILTIALFSLIVLIGFSILNISSKPLTIVNMEYNVQSNIRGTISSISNYIEKSSAIFIHADIEPVFTDNDLFSIADDTNEVIKLDDNFINTQNSSKKNEFLSAIEKYKGWNFLVFSDDGKELREFTYKTENGKGYYELRRIINRQTVDGKDIVYNLEFKKNSPELYDNLISFILKGNLENEDYIEITTEMKAYNSLQVVDRSGYEQGRVLFYKENLESQAAVAMVLDTSGSMKDKTIYEGQNIKKIDALKKSSKKLINSFAGLNNTELSIIKFNTNANNPNILKPVSSNISSLLQEIDKLVEGGGTNIGDGIRRAYHILKGYNDTSLAHEEAYKYLIILMDGVPTYGSVNNKSYEYKEFDQDKGTILDEGNGNLYYLYKTLSKTSGTIWNRTTVPYEWHYRRPSNYKLTDGNVSSSNLIGTGTENDENIVYGMGYITRIENELINIKNLKVFLIGLFTDLGEDSKEIKYFNMIKDVLSKPDREVDGFITTDGDKLNMAVTQIEESILGNYWRIYGPGE
ncbi:MAG: VWA domain-containing protein [Tissierellaceae bacterium]|nr:VWA domain-containing protein [Tissierellaceae bacterium]